MSSIPHSENAARTPGAHPRSLLRRFLAVAPTAATLALLAGFAFWGHSTGWKLPTLASFNSSDADVDDWCSEHNVPESMCIECKPGLVADIEDYGWCKLHGVSQCPLEHPDVAQLKEVPIVSSEVIARADRALGVRPRAENNSLCKLYLRRIQFASTNAVEKAGVDIEVVQRRPVIETISANGEVVYDQTKMARFSSRASGTLWQADKNVGDKVSKGELLALVDAGEVGVAKSELLQAIAEHRLNQSTLDRLKSIGTGGVISGKQLMEAEAGAEKSEIRVQAARQTLINLGLPIRIEELDSLGSNEIARRIHFLGIPENIASSFDPNTTTSNLLPVTSSLDGVVISRNAVPGEVVAPENVLFGVADVSHLWLILNVRQEDAKFLALNQEVRFQASSEDAAPVINGNLQWISTEVDDASRTVSARVELPNPDGTLRANTFGVGQIVLREEPEAVVVPTEAIHWDGTCQVVFVRDKHYFEPDAPKFFHVRQVRTGVKDNNVTEVIVGLLPGEVIASKNSVVLESQLLKGNLGAGCDCVQ